MKFKPRPRAARCLALLALCGLPAASHAALVVYTSAASFQAAVIGAATDDFDSLAPGVTITSPLTRTAGAFSYGVAVLPDATYTGEGSPVPPGYIVAAGTAADRWLSTNSSTDTLRLQSLGGISAIGGFFFGSDIDGRFAPGATIEFLATDAQGAQSYTLSGATLGSFVGFISDTTLVSLSLRAQQAGGDVWVSANNLQLAQAVPEPGSLLLVLGGLGLLGLMTRARRA